MVKIKKEEGNAEELRNYEQEEEKKWLNVV